MGYNRELEKTIPYLLILLLIVILGMVACPKINRFSQKTEDWIERTVAVEEFEAYHKR